MAKDDGDKQLLQNGTLSTQLDRDLAARAYRKLKQGDTPTAQERAALKRYEKEQEETRRWHYYQTIPQKHWRQMSGRQTKILHEQADRYGIPFGGRVINLPTVVRSLHDFLAANARQLRHPDDAETLPPGESLALEEYRKEKMMLARLDRMQRQGQLLDRDMTHHFLGHLAARLRALGDQLQRSGQIPAFELLQECLDDFEAHVDSFFELDGNEATP